MDFAVFNLPKSEGYVFIKAVFIKKKKTACNCLRSHTALTHHSTTEMIGLKIKVKNKPPCTNKIY